MDRVQHFLLDRRAWIAKHWGRFQYRMRLAKPYCDKPLRSGSQLLYAGRSLTLSIMGQTGYHSSTAYVYNDASTLTVETACPSGPDQHGVVAESVERWMRARLRERAVALTETVAEGMGVMPAGLKIKTQKRRWGSCGPTGLINLNWRLAMAPDTVVGYVVVHELAHLVHRNHGPHFWALVAAHCPDYAMQKQWLNEHDAILFNSLNR